MQTIVILVTFAVVCLFKPHFLVTLTATFRASGRLVWSICYAGLIGSVVLMARFLDRKWAAAIVACAALVQFIDQQPLRQTDRHLYVQNQAHDDQLAALSQLVSLHKNVSLVPEFTCTRNPDGILQFVDTIVATSMANVPVDNTYAARRAVIPCPKKLRVVPSDDTLVISALPGLVDTTGLDCRSWSSQVVVCSTRWSELSPAARAWFS